VRDFLLKYAESMNHFLLDRKARVEEDVSTERISLEKRLTLDEFKKELETILSVEGGEWKTIIERYYS
jgi:hypothetical protein